MEPDTPGRGHCHAGRQESPDPGKGQQGMAKGAWLVQHVDAVMHPQFCSLADEYTGLASV